MPIKFLLKRALASALSVSSRFGPQAFINFAVNLDLVLNNGLTLGLALALIRKWPGAYSSESFAAAGSLA